MDAVHPLGFNIKQLDFSFSKILSDALHVQNSSDLLKQQHTSSKAAQFEELLMFGEG